MQFPVLSPTKPLVSVIIPCFRQGHFLNECIRSLQTQTYPHWEAIIVNDGSPDNTAEIATTLCSTDKRIRYLEKTNGGLSSARNFGLTAIQGEYVQFLDADDLLLPEKLESHFLFENNNNTITYTDYFHGAFNNPLERVNGLKLNPVTVFSRPIIDFSLIWEFGFSIPIHSALFPRQLIDSLGQVFDTQLNNHEDWDFWMRVVKLTDELIFIPRELAIYRVSNHSMSRNKDLMWSGFNSAIKKNKILNGNDEDIQACLRILSYKNDFNHYKGLAGMGRKLSQLKSFRWLPWRLQQRIKGQYIPRGINSMLKNSTNPVV